MDKYRLASGLAFYRNKADHSANTQPSRSVQETTGRQIFGMDALMYNFWLSPADAAARDILVISERKEYLADNLFKGRGQHLGKIHSYSTKKHGKEVGSYYYRLITRYSPAGPAIPVSGCICQLESTAFIERLHIDAMNILIIDDEP